MKKINEIIKFLTRQYPETKTALIHSNPFQLLVATILSAQSTDKQVNKITPQLFEKFKGPADFAGSSLKKIEQMVSSVNFYKNKAKYIYQLSKILTEKYNNKVPDTMEELIKLPGVARKTANVVLSQGFGKNEGIVVDTHVKRVSARLGLTQNTDPVKIEEDLMKIIPKTQWKDFAFRLILHGRNICIAKKPRCQLCIIEKLCPSSILKKGKI
ncbi:MAG: endonuclease III [Candidatus Omnitrophica bacterium]|jgi:endonuclease-3|nr:endonuclease III [Candidatus Omnitrophota bacterium]